MLEKKYLPLQNGSDVRGVALEGIEGEHVNLTEEIAYYIVSGFVHFVSEKTGKQICDLKISVGHDSRLSANFLKNGALKGIQDCGAMAIDCSLASTPSMFMSCILDKLQYDGAIMITASHLPFNRNGLKFFTKEGGLESKDIKWLLNKAIVLESESFVKGVNHEIQSCDLLGYYSANMRSIICRELQCNEQDLPLKDMHIVVDAGNGAGGFFASRVLQPLGANIDGSLYLDPDGSFPNHIPNPENAKAMEAIRKATVENHADLGIIFDTDVDRAATVLSNGKEINKNALIALMSAILVKDYPNSTIVTDSVTSDQLEDFLVNRLGLQHHRFKRGYRNVINESIRLNNEGIVSPLAIETSGHGALKENYFLDDGAYMSVKILIEAVRCKKEGKSIGDLLDGLEEALETKECRLRILVDDFKTYGLQVLDDFKVFAKNNNFIVVEPNYEGVRISFNNDQVQGWLLVRMSLHDPILPMNIEANTEGGVEMILSLVRPFFKKYEHLNVESLG
ncbi:MAG: phosphomannomutase/phosphoglucomutase [Erysipelotrichaceae bacterium]|nr:phosphomannomutase/phosphoglucomutase [Erysipelotrichaceae bacterium]